MTSNTKTNRRNNPYISKVVDTSYYRQAIDSDDLLSLDYSLHRVFNNPDFSNKRVITNLLDLDARKGLKRTVILDDSCESILDHSFQNTMMKILDSIDSQDPEVENLLRTALAWFLITHKLLEDCSDELLDNLRSEINAIYHSEEPVNFNTLIEVCGNRWQAEKGRKTITDMISGEYYDA